MNKRLLQLSILIFGFVPVIAGGYGVITDPLIQSDTIILSENHTHYLSGILFGIGIIFWSLIPKIEHKTREIRLLTLIVFIGGIARLSGTIFHGEFSSSIAFALTMELIITPSICLWQGVAFNK